jgi:PAS domain S-box-containing protein
VVAHVAVTPVLVVVLLSAMLATVLAYAVWRERPKTGATAMAVSAFALALWGVGQVVVLSSDLRWLAIAGLTTTYLGQALIPPAWYVFGHQYTGRMETVPRRTLAALAVGPLLIVALGATNGLHELLWVDLTVTADGAVTYGFGIGTALHAAYSYLLTAGGTRHLLSKFFASRNVYRTRTLLFIVIATTVVATSATSFLGLSPVPHLTLTSVIFLGLAVVSLLSVASNRFLAALPTGQVLSALSSGSRNLTPVARDTAIEDMENGFVVCDHKNRIVDINPMGKRIFGQADKRVVGRELTDVLPPEIIVRDDTEFLEPDATGTYTGIWVEAPTGERRCFDTTISPLGTGDDGDLTGRVALVHDVTERERRKQKLEERTEQLERQNEQLESFAGIVSHDLRNPLNVAESRLELVDARLDAEQDSIEEAQKALDRMEDIISDVLTLARLGQSVSETEPVEIGTLARTAWENVDTEAATLDCDLTLEVTGDENRLLQLFENLYRNAVEHGGTDVTVTVGRHGDGFYVADDGPGIPEENQSDVFEEGFTTNRDGTGFGLAIVETIVEAHGWEVSVTDSKTGGARFEVSDVIAPQEQVAKSAP